MTGWHKEPMAPFDIESGGVDVEADGVVTVTVATVGKGDPRIWSGLIAVDFDIDPKAIEIHHITTEHARANGKPAADVLNEAADRLTYSLGEGTPVLGSNLVYDWTIFDRNCRRYGVATVTDRLGGSPIAPVLDVLVLDRHLDRYRPGKRTLERLCEVYDVKHGGTHDATEDALAAARIAYRIGARSHGAFDQLTEVYADRRFPDRLAKNWMAFAKLTLPELHQAQIGWYREYAEGLGTYWAKQRAEFLAHAGRDNPPPVEGLPDAGPDERREVWRQHAVELAERIASLRYEWPIAPLAVTHA